MRIIAHRGASAYAPENTLAAISLALRMGAREVEFDVHRTRDGRLVVLHDADLRRVAGVKKIVSSLAFRDLRALDAGAWFGAGFAGERVPALEEVLDLLGDRALAHIEVKEGIRTYPGMARDLLDLLRREGAEGRCVISSFHHPTLRELRRLDPDVRLAVLQSAPAGPAVLKTAAEVGAVSVDLSRRAVGVRLVEAARGVGVQVLAYTVNDRKELERLEALGVEGVFSDRPDILAQPARPEAAAR